MFEKIQKFYGEDKDGYCNELGIWGTTRGKYGYYWQSNYYTDTFSPNIFFSSSSVRSEQRNRFYGLSVRAVRS